MADVRTTQKQIREAARQADAALAMSIEIFRSLVEAKVLSPEQAASVATSSLSAASPDQRLKIAAVIREFLPEYVVPRFSVFGSGVAQPLGNTDQKGDL